MSIKPLFIAFACEPERGSEPGIGWNCVYHASRHRPVWVITDALHRNKIEASLARHDEQNINVVYHALPDAYQWMWKHPFMLNLYYYLWHRGAAKLARKLNEEHHFDVVHHVSYVRYWMPSAAGFVGVPFVWGPVGGGESAPPGFLRGLGLKARAEELVRSLMRWIFERDPALRNCAQAANVAIACSTESAEKMKRLGVKKLITLSCIGMTPKEELACPEKPADSKVRFISVGRLLHWKGFQFGLQAFAKANLPNAEYVIVGDGPEMRRLKSLAAKLGVHDRVRFTGEVPWREALEQFKQADVLIHPSLHDSGGFVLLEAMEMAKPVICLELGGPALHVDSRNGFAVPAISIKQVVDDMGRAMTQLANDSDLRRRLGEAGRTRATTEFTWESKAKQFEEIYYQITGKPRLQEELKSNP